MSAKINKAVFPVAGMGTRFLPATKANPKEMMPIVDKPLIQYAVEEAAAAGIKEMIFVTSSTKRAIEDHFDSNFELEAKLAESNKHKLLELVRAVVPQGVKCIYIRQPHALGLGHAVLCAREVVGDQAFAVILADDLIDGGEKAVTQQMLEAFQQSGRSIIAVQEVASDEIEKYGVVALDQTASMPKAKICGIVEKPKSADAPSNFGVVGRYILTPRIFHFLENLSSGAGGEIQLTDAIAKLLQVEDIYAYQFQGKRYDCGDKLGYLEATIAYALKHPELAVDFKQQLLSITKNLK